MVKRKKRRTRVLGIRLTPKEWKALDALCREDELLSECARRILMDRAKPAEREGE